MLSKAELKTLKSLHESKGRSAERLFLAEGLKLIAELLGAYSCALLVVSEELESEVKALLSTYPPKEYPKRIEVVPRSFEWGRISSLRQPQGAMAAFSLPEMNEGFPPTPSGLSIFLDRVQDPGNLGTILRTADWYGVRDVFLAPGTADPYAPKVVQATMGALARVRLHRLSEPLSFLRKYEGELLGTFLGGEDLYTAKLPSSDASALLIMGNEGQGIQPEIEALVQRRLTIPPYPRGGGHTESLNVAIATAILLSELRRRG